MKHTIIAHYVAALGMATTTLCYAEDKVIELPLSGPAYRLATEAYRAYDQADYAAAVEKAREAVRLRPDVPRLKELLDNAIRARDAAAHAQDVRSAAGSGNSRSGRTRQAAGPEDGAYAAASEAYRAIARGGFDAAVAAARKAVALAPRKREYRLLLADALIGAKRLEEADAALSGAIAEVGDANGKLASYQSAVRLQLAAGPMRDYYRAQEARDRQASLAAARRLAALLPQVPAYRLILIRALLDNERLDEAQSQADAAVALAPSDYAPRAMRAAVLHLRGSRTQAGADFDAALALAQRDPGADRNVRLIAADAALAGRDPERAAALVAALADAGDDEAARRVRQARSQPGTAAGRSLSASVFAVPELSCRTASFGQACALVPGLAPKDPGYDMAALAYQALASREYPLAAEKARQAHALAPDNLSYSLLLVNSLAAGGEAAEAERAASAALDQWPDNAELLMARGQARKRQSKTEQARADFAAALARKELPEQAEIALLVELGRRQEASARFTAARDNARLEHMSEVDLAYLADAVGQSDAALAHFLAADGKQELPPGALHDAAYAAMRNNRPDLAIQYFKRATDLVAENALVLEPNSQFAARRATAELSRTWGMFGGVTYRGATALPGSVPGTAGAENDSVQAGAEFYWRPFGYQAQGQVELFGRAFETLYSKAGNTAGAPSVQGSAGARIKPFGAQNLYLALSRLVPLGARASADWLAQVSYFAGSGVDLRMDADSWTTAQLSAEVGRYFQQSSNYGLVSGQIGKSYRLAGNGGNVVAFPHAVLAADYGSAFARRNSVGAGPGVTFRFWFNEDKYMAHRSYADLTVQYRTRLGGDERATGTFVSLSFSY